MAEQSEEFYVTLPSDASAVLYPENKPNNYVTKLRKTIELAGADWEVALVDISYPRRWRNVLRTSKISFLYRSGVEQWKGKDIHEKAAEFRWAVVQKEYYRWLMEGPPDNIDWNRNTTNANAISAFESIQKHLNSLDDLSSVDPEDPDTEDEIALFCNDIVPMITEFSPCHMRSPLDIAHQLGYLLRKLRLTMYESLDGGLIASVEPSTGELLLEGRTDSGKPLNIYMVTEDRYLFDLMGIEPIGQSKDPHKMFYLYGTPCFSTKTPMLDDFGLLYVYSDVATYQPVGDTEGPLLGVLPVQGGLGEQIYWVCNPAYYVPVAKTSIDTIEVQLNTDDGRLVPFEDAGKVFVRLHFRPRGLAG
jgi:hypothetical protein